MHMFAFCVFLSFLALFQCTECPLGCQCSAATNTVRCVSKDLRSVPLSIPGYARTLVVTGNHIHRIGAGSFPELENLTNVCLSDNRISEVGSHTFSSMTRLRSLDLSLNRLALIHPEALSVPGSPLQELNLSRSLYNTTSLTDLAAALRWGGLAGLLRLDLSGNRPGLLAPATFSHLPSLQHLLLPHNSLVSVYSGAFSGLTRLTLLDLSHNAFRMFPDEALEEFGRLGPDARLLLGQNPYLCSCEIRGFVAWLNSSSVTPRLADPDELRCAAPRGLREARLRDVRGDAGCDSAPPAGRGEEADRLSLGTSYALLGLVLGLVVLVFLFVLYLNRRGMKQWITDMRDGCHDVLEGYHYRYDIDHDPRLGRMASGATAAAGSGHFGTAPSVRLPSDTRVDVQTPTEQVTV
ncbi:hypothetical protein NHX12_001841 [Muraenolepis orangiensis]|uniref:Trophoblast glycoprotein-like n=1 Tax=Muraenolepis orangiensis TaxID=630683 RepID=A0A9Q0IHK3_9TELE|nr:hypothetical protein NHX12_001841 [Muraenolepis orangiensis]